LIWISSWGPLKLCDAIRRTTSAPPGQNPAGQDLEASLSRSPSHDSNAPIKPKSQSNLSNIVARLTAIRGCIGPISKLQSRRALDTGRHAVRESGHWHETDMPKYLGDVRCCVNSRKRQDQVSSRREAWLARFFRVVFRPHKARKSIAILLIAAC